MAQLQLHALPRLHCLAVALVCLCIAFVQAQPASSEGERPKTGRHILKFGPFPNKDTFIWTVVTSSIVGFTSLVVTTATVVWFKCFRQKSDAVKPLPDRLVLDEDEAAKSTEAVDESYTAGNSYQKFSERPAVSNKGVDNPDFSLPAQGPVEVCEDRPNFMLVPGIALASYIPDFMEGVVSNPRPPTGPPYERLLLISSRVHDINRVIGATHASVAVVAYDWRHSSLQYLAHCIRHALNGGRVLSVAVAAPTEVPGIVSLLEREATLAGRLSDHPELLLFWRVLAGMVTTNPIHDGRRVDLLGCGTTYDPKVAALLLKELWQETGVPFAASDDAKSGYLLRTFMENPATKELSLATSNLRVFDLYFNRSLLDVCGAMENPHQWPSKHDPGEEITSANLRVSSNQPPLPPGSPPPHALTPVAPYVSGDGQGHETHVINASPKGSDNMESSVHGTHLSSTRKIQTSHQNYTNPEQSKQLDVFNRFMEEVHAKNTDIEQLLHQMKAADGGVVDTTKVCYVVKHVLPNASRQDILHVKALLDVGGSQYSSIQDLTSAAKEAAEVERLVSSGSDTNRVLHRLYNYLNENQDILRVVFHDLSQNGSGCLEQSELQQLVDMIPGMELHEKKYILAYLYQIDPSTDGRLTFEDVLAMAQQS